MLWLNSYAVEDKRHRRRHLPITVRYDHREAPASATYSASSLSWDLRRSGSRQAERNQSQTLPRL